MPTRVRYVPLLISVLQDWEGKYLHPGFWNATREGVKVDEPCPDVYMFPLFTEEGADAFVEVMEDYGKWSDGGNKVGNN